MSKKVSNQEFLEAKENVEYQKIMSTASRCFARCMSREELESCKMVALWRALSKYDKDNESNNKFTSYLYWGTYLECKSTTKFLLKNKDKQQYVVDHENFEDRNRDYTDLYEELSRIPDGDILYDYYIKNMKLQEIADIKKCSKQNIVLKKKKALDLIRDKFK